MKNILVVFGTRPEAIKLAPVILELKKHPDKFNVIVCNTEQQKELSNQTLGFFNIAADIKLDVMVPNQTLPELQSNLLRKLAAVHAENDVDGTIVQGDTMTVFCGALTSFYNRKPVFHVEAGLRSYDMGEPFPEEAMRAMTSRITDLHFAPTEENRKMLLAERIDDRKILVTGNTVIDALFSLPDERIRESEEFFSAHVKEKQKLVLVTAHRRENHGERLEQILDAVKQLAGAYKDHSFIIPVHPNPNVKDRVHNVLSGIDNISLMPPLDYPNLVWLTKNSRLILTDSGGIQEEATAFGTPLLVLRNETERQEGVEAGIAKLVGADKDAIISEARRRLDSADDKKPLQIYGDGKASRRIAEAIGRYFKL